MFSRRWITVLTVCAALAGVEGRADEADLAAKFNELLPGMGAEREYKAPQQKWQTVCLEASAPSHEAERVQACRLMAGKLGPETPARARVWLLTQLGRIGHAPEVEAVAGCVGDSDRLVRDAAIRALANIPDPAAGAKLRELVSGAGDDERRTALINAIGFRGEPVSAAVLVGALQTGSPAVASASARALGKLGTVEAVAALEAALDKARAPVRVEVSDALARCAVRSRREGRAAEAAKIGDVLARADGTARLAGLKLLLRSRDDASPLVLDVLAGGKPEEAAVVLGHVRYIPKAGISRLADGLVKLSPTAQVELLRALGPRRERAALPAVVAAARHADPAVRLAALEALGGVGDASTVALLDEAMRSGGDAANAARRSLERVFADGVDEAVVALMKAQSDPGRRAQLIEILERRRASSAVPALLAETNSDDGNVRRRAIVALANVAGAGDVAAMVRGLLRMKEAAERGEAERAVAQVCARIAESDLQADPVLEVYRAVSPPEQVALLTLLGRIGGPKALVVLRESVADADASRRGRSIAALCEWPDTAVADDLAKLAESTSEGELKHRLIGALARVAVLPGERSNEDRLALLGRAMKQASRPEERRAVIDRARQVHSIEAVRLAATGLDDPKTAALSCAVVVDLLHHDEVRNRHRDEADRLLDRVIEISKDRGLVERARSFKSKP